jgi:hypothetical protein
VAGLIGDDALGDPSRGSRGRKTGSQRVPGYFARVEPGSGSAALQHKCHRIAAETRRAQVAMAVHGTERVSLGDT